jgi:activating signal cointegrator complex subunit 1
MLADRLVDKFVSANLMQRQYERVKLHITVMNTLFRKDASGAAEPQWNPRGLAKDRESFYAKSLLQVCGLLCFLLLTVFNIYASMGKSKYFCTNFLVQGSQCRSLVLVEFV